MQWRLRLFQNSRVLEGCMHDHMSTGGSIRFQMICWQCTGNITTAQFINLI